MNIYLIFVDNKDKIKFKKIKVKKIDPEGFHTIGGSSVSIGRINTFMYSPCHIYFLDKKIAERCFLKIQNNAVKSYQESIDFYRDRLKKFKRQKWKGKVEWTFTELFM